MLAKTPLRDLAIAWLETKNPKGQYDWQDARYCACAQLAQALGREVEWASRGEVRYREWADLDMIARGPFGRSWVWTFGKFLQRLRAAA